MADLGTPKEFIRDGEKQVAVYRKLQKAAKATPCDGTCGRSIAAGTQYERIQLVTEKPGEDLHDRHQARSVAFQRRVILRFHVGCALSPEEHR